MKLHLYLSIPLKNRLHGIIIWMKGQTKVICKEYILKSYIKF